MALPEKIKSRLLMQLLEACRTRAPRADASGLFRHHFHFYTVADSTKVADGAAAELMPCPIVQSTIRMSLKEIRRAAQKEIEFLERICGIRIVGMATAHPFVRRIRELNVNRHSPFGRGSSPGSFFELQQSKAKAYMALPSKSRRDHQPKIDQVV